MDERWKGLPRARLEEGLAARKRHLPQMREDLRRIEDSIAWWREHSFDGPLEGEQEAADSYRSVIQQVEDRIAAMEAFLAPNAPSQAPPPQ